MTTTTEQRLAAALRTIDEKCKTGLNSSVYSRWSEALEGAMRAAREALAEYGAQRAAQPGAWREDADVAATFDDGRKETVIELTNGDHSETYGYALPEHAARIVQCVNAHDGLVAALAAVKQWSDVSGLDDEWPAVMDSVNAALAAAGVQA